MWEFPSLNKEIFSTTDIGDEQNLANNFRGLVTAAAENPWPTAGLGAVNSQSQTFFIAHWVGQGTKVPVIRLGFINSGRMEQSTLNK